MTAPPLERDAVLAAIHAVVGDATRGHGSTVLVTGEAGIGKTSVVRAFHDGVADRTTAVLRGSCDDLFAARPLGPLREAARSVPAGPLAAALAEPTTTGVAEAVVAELAARGRGRSSVLVIEDVHWADEGTLDVLAYLVRRISALPAVLLLTFRDDESAPRDHPMHRVLAALIGQPVRRFALEPLSAEAVRSLASGTGWDAESLLDLTGGNPFFVSETLTGPPRDEVPQTVSDAVLARIARLPADTADALERLSVIPTYVDFATAAVLLQDRLDRLEPAEERGVVQVRPDGVTFRHELARRAVEHNLSGLRRRQLHAAVVDVLRSRADPDLARLVHHATRAGDAATVARYAPLAGRQAAAAGCTARRWCTSTPRCGTPTCSPTANGRGCSTSTPGSSTTPTGSPKPSATPRSRSHCWMSSVTRSPRPRPWYGCLGTATWRATPTAR